MNQPHPKINTYIEGSLGESGPFRFPMGRRKRDCENGQRRHMPGDPPLPLAMSWKPKEEGNADDDNQQVFGGLNASYMEPIPPVAVDVCPDRRIARHPAPSGLQGDPPNFVLRSLKRSLVEFPLEPADGKLGRTNWIYSHLKKLERDDGCGGNHQPRCGGPLLSRCSPRKIKEEQSESVDAGNHGPPTWATIGVVADVIRERIELLFRGVVPHPADSEQVAAEHEDGKREKQPEAEAGQPAVGTRERLRDGHGGAFSEVHRGNTDSR